MAVALAAFLALAFGFLVLPPAARAYTPHAPILILGDAGFTASNGVVGGAGTRDDPYVIEGWEIDASSGHGVEVRGTGAHFVIRGVRVHSGGPSFDGILLQSASDASVTDSVVQYNANGVRLVDVRRVTVSRSNASLNSFDGISTAASSNVSIQGNRVEYNGDGIYIESVRDARVSGNALALNRQDGLFCYNATNVVVEANAVTRNGWAGLHVSTAASLVVSANSVSGNSRAGISLESSTQVLVHGNTAFSNLANGMLLDGIQELVLSANVVSSSGQTGVSIGASRDLNVTGNTVSGNRYGGIVLAGAERTSLSGNRITNNSNGVSFLFSRDVRIEGNNVSHNQEYGAYLADIETVTVARNHLAGNEIGVGIEGCRNATVEANEVRDGTYGLYLFRCSGLRTFHNSFESNLVPGMDDMGAENAWDDGYPSGGNYWSDYGGYDRCSGANQTDCPRADGIGDVLYVVDPTSIDRYPLMRPYGTANREPTALFTVSPLDGDVSTVFAVDAAYSADDKDLAATLQVRWDWEGDGVWDTAWSSAKTAEHRYASPGQYSIRLEVRDSDGRSSRTELQVSVRPVPLPPFLFELGLAVVIGTVTAGLAYWGYVRWRRGWFRRAQNRRRSGTR